MGEMFLFNFHDPKRAFGSVPANLPATQNLQFVPYPVAASALLPVCIISAGKAATT